MTSKRVFICADHGLAVFYFLKSDIVRTLLQAGVEVIVLTEDNTRQAVEEQFGQPGLTIEGLRLDKIQAYLRTVSPQTQYWLDFLRRAGAHDGTNIAAVDTYIEQVKNEAHSRRRRLLPLMLATAKLMRKSRPLRRVLVGYQGRFNPGIYGDLFEKYRPDLVIAGSPGFRLDRFLLREAAARKVPSVACIISWDSSSSYGLPGATIDSITCWSEIQKSELMGGADWPSERVNVGGMPPYDGYVRKEASCPESSEWVLPRAEYFRLHGLDPERKLLTYASSFVNLSPNIQNIEALARLAASDQLAFPAQVLVRFHPNHMNGHFTHEADQIRQLARENPLVHVIEPATFGAMGHYSVDDLVDRTSMMAHSDVFMTVYSTMVVEASFQECPIVSVCIDSTTGYPGHYWIPFSKIAIWPTHSRFRASKAGRVVTNETELRDALNYYLLNPHADLSAIRQFRQQECANPDGSAGRSTAGYFLTLLRTKSVRNKVESQRQGFQI
jgi:hypothetical protein